MRPAQELLDAPLMDLTIRPLSRASLVAVAMCFAPSVAVASTIDLLAFDLFSFAQPQTVWAGSTSQSLNFSAAVIGDGVSDPTGQLLFELVPPFGIPYQTVVDVNGSGIYSTNTLDLFPGGEGTYTWAFRYSGDSNYDPTPWFYRDVNVFGLTTLPSPSAPIAGSGIPLRDEAQLSAPADVTGFLSFLLMYEGGAIVWVELVEINGPGFYETPAGFEPTLPGFYAWGVGYSGDGNYGSIAAEFNEPIFVGGQFPAPVPEVPEVPPVILLGTGLLALTVLRKQLQLRSPVSVSKATSRPPSPPRPA